MAYRTAPREYFDLGIKSMKDQGFDVLAWVTMNSHRHHYFTDAYRFAQESRLFFVAPGQTLVVMLELRELFGRKIGPEAWDEGYYLGYWSGFICFTHDHRRAFRDFLTGKLNEDLSLDDNEVWDLPITRCFQGTPFEIHWSSSLDGIFHYQLEPKVRACTQQDLPKAADLTQPFGGLLKKIYPYLYRRFRSLQVTDFAPHLSFPRQEREFWEKFPISRLRAIAPHIWGSRLL